MRGDPTCDPYPPAIAQIREDPETYAPGRQLGDAVRDPLGHAVDEVRAHGVAAVDEHVHDDHAVLFGAEEAHLEITSATAAYDEPGHRAVGTGEQVLALGLDAHLGALAVGDIVDLDLAYHEGLVHLGHEAPACADHLGGVRGRGDDARLLDDHGHHTVAAVDPHVEGHAVGERVRAEHVLDELVGRVGVEASAVEGALDLDGLDARRVAHERAALRDVDLVETG